MFMSNQYLKTIAIATVLTAIASSAWGQEQTGEAPAAPALTPEMQGTMNPAVWSRLMAAMMNPQAHGNSAEVMCGGCHGAEDVARYEKDFGPMMNMTRGRYGAMMNPQMWNGMMAPYMGMMGMMNPMMMGPMMNMMNPAMMMGPMTNMMNPGMMMGPMANMMNPGMMMGPMANMMNPGMMMGPMTNMMNPGTMMGPAMGMLNPEQYGQWFESWSKAMESATAQGGQAAARIMDPKQFEQWMNSWSQMMKQYSGAQTQ